MQSDPERARPPALNAPEAAEAGVTERGDGAIVPVIDHVATLFELGLGPWVFPLRGKIPIEEGWRSADSVDESTVRRWLAEGHNLGLRTGVKSGVVVIDDDRIKHGLEPYDLPPSGLCVLSPTGSRHNYYLRPPDAPCPRNSASLLAPKVDVRGEGGYVVIPPSIHPDAKRPYVWAETGQPAAWPEKLLEAATQRRKAGRSITVDMTRGQRGYAEAALEREAAAVRAAPEGTRNDSLNRAAFNLGQLVAGGELVRETVCSELASAAREAGLDEAETSATIDSGIAAGAQSPRSRPERGRKPSAGGKPDVLVPGSHTVPKAVPGGPYIEQSTAKCAAEILDALPRGSLYLRATDVGEVIDASFVPVNAERLRSIIDHHVRLCAGTKDKDDEPTIVFRPCARDYATVVLAYGRASGKLPELQTIARAPVMLADGSILDRAGFHEQSGVLYVPTARYGTVPRDPGDEEVLAALALLLDPFSEFPFAAPADRAALVALLLTLAARTAFDGPAPGWLVTAPTFGAGKDKLARCAAIAITSVEPKSLAAPSGREADNETRKKITSELIAGTRVAIIENIPDGDILRSTALCAVLTARTWTDRDLGLMRSVSAPAKTIWVATGVNTTTADDLARRMLRVRLIPQSEGDRVFRVADLEGHVTADHPRLVVAALTVLRGYVCRGRPSHGRAPLGSFEGWDAIVRSCVCWVTALAGWPSDPVDTLQAARRDAPDRLVLDGVLTAWLAAFGDRGATGAEAIESTHDGLRAALGAVADGREITGHLLGQRLRAWMGRAADGRRFERVGTRHGAAVWRVVAVGGGVRGVSGESASEMTPPENRGSRP